MLLNMIDGKIGPLLDLYHTKAHTAFEDGVWHVNKRVRENRPVPPRPVFSQRKGNILVRMIDAPSI